MENQEQDKGPLVQTTKRLRGRPKGSKNKQPENLKDALYRAFHHPQVGGVRFLVKLAKKHPTQFVSLLSKMIPADITMTTTMTIDIGAAMIAAEKRQAALLRGRIRDQADKIPTIDVTPVPHIPKSLETNDS